MTKKELERAVGASPIGAIIITFTHGRKGNRYLTKGKFKVENRARSYWCAMLGSKRRPEWRVSTYMQYVCDATHEDFANSGMPKDDEIA